MEIINPEFRPDPADDSAAMKAQQRSIARRARFEPRPGFDSRRFTITAPIDPEDRGGSDGGDGVVVGVDQAFTDESAVSVAVAIQDGGIVESARGWAPLDIPYIPGLLAYREAGAILDAFAGLGVDPDLVAFDGSGRIHYRQAGIATHVGVLFDVPAIGVAKNLLCGTPEDDPSRPLSDGTVIPITADDDVEGLAATDPDWPVIGAAYQSRQYPDPGTHHINPLYVSPGHRLDTEATVSTVAELCVDHKLPEPVRVADHLVGRLVAED